MPHLLTPHKKTRAIHASHTLFGTLLLPSFPSITLQITSYKPYSPKHTTPSNNHTFPSQHHSNFTLTITEYTWQRFRAFFLASLIHLQHSRFILPSQLQDILTLFSLQPDTCRQLIHHHLLPDNLTDQSHIFKQFLLDALLQLIHLKLIHYSQFNLILSFISTHSLYYYQFIPSHIPNTPTFANETLLFNTLLISFKQHLFLPSHPHLFVMHFNSHSIL